MLICTTAACYVELSAQFPLSHQVASSSRFDDEFPLGLRSRAWFIDPTFEFNESAVNCQFENDTDPPTFAISYASLIDAQATQQGTPAASTSQRFAA
jgi:hypothetical protein